MVKVGTCPGLLFFLDLSIEHRLSTLLLLAVCQKFLSSGKYDHSA